MPLSVGLVCEARAPEDARARLLSAPLEARGDEVTPHLLEAGASLLSRARAYGELLRGVVAHKPDVLVLSGTPRAASLVAAVARVAGVELVLDLAVRGDGGPRTAAATVVDVLAAAAATRVVARDVASYQALLAARVPVYRVGLVHDPLVVGSFAARAKEPPAKGRVRVVAIVSSADELATAVTALEAARAREPKIHGVVVAPPGARLAAEVAVAGREGLEVAPSEPMGLDDEPTRVARALIDAHLALVLGPAGPQAGVVMATGAPLVWVSAERPWGADGAEWRAPSEARLLGERLGELARDKDARGQLAARGRAWDEAYGYAAMSRVWLRTVDAACEAKVLAERRAKQAALEGVKTGTRAD